MSILAKAEFFNLDVTFTDNKEFPYFKGNANQHMGDRINRSLVPEGGGQKS